MHRSLSLVAWLLIAPVLLTEMLVAHAVVPNRIAAKSAVEVGRIAKAITVEIKAIGSTEIGSGILLQQQGDVYTVLTAGHVAQKGAKFTLKTSDGQVHQSIAGSVRLTGNNIDLGVMKFRSSNKYALAKISTSNTLELGSPIYVAGFLEPTYAVTEAGVINFTEGKVIGKGTKGNEKGYSLQYTNITRSGMSGGAVLNEDGELVAIHGQGAREGRESRSDKMGRNLGIVVERYGQVAAALGVVAEQRIAALPVNQKLNATDYFIAGNDKYDNGNYQGALADYNQAIALDPKNSLAYYNRGTLKYIKLDDPLEALIDFNQAISLDPKNSLAYTSRGYLGNKYLENVQGALADYNQAIALDPKYSLAYYNRGLLKYEELNDVQGALADLNQAIALNPKYSLAYYNRGLLKYLKNDVREALADFNQVIVLDPKGPDAYTARAVLKYQHFNDAKGALKDFNQAIILNPGNLGSYYNRGDFHYSLGNKAAAIADFRQVVKLLPTEAIEVDGKIAQGVIDLEQGTTSRTINRFNQAAVLSPESPDIYKYRGVAYQKLGNKANAIRDWQQAAKLYKKNQPKDYEMVKGWLRQLGAGE
jgi:tetratricopeptide (TPR) repeat protein